MKFYSRLSKFLLVIGIVLIPVMIGVTIVWRNVTFDEFSFAILLDSQMTPLGLVVMFGWLFCPLFLLSSPMVFARYSRFFPLNNFAEFEVKFNNEAEVLKFGHFVDTQGTFAIVVKQKQPGIWMVFGEEKDIRLDLCRYPFPKRYLCAFFVRNFNYRDHNMKKRYDDKLYKPTQISWLKKINSVKLIFDVQGERTEEYCIENKKTKLKYLTRLVATADFEEFGKYQHRHRDKVSERWFRKRCNYFVFRKENRKTDCILDEINCILNDEGNLIPVENDARLHRP